MSSPLRAWAGRPVVIDSSVACKWFEPLEDGSEQAAELLRAHGRDEIALLAPAHLPLEVINVLTCRRVGVDAIERAVRFIADTDLLVAALDEELLVDAARIAHAEGLALYDTAFIALATRHDAELVTADRRQAATRSCRVRFVG